MCLFRSCFSLDICPGGGLQAHMVVLFLVFEGTSILFSIVAVPVYIPTNNYASVLTSSIKLTFYELGSRYFSVAHYAKLAFLNS